MMGLDMHDEPSRFLWNVMDYGVPILVGAVLLWAIYRGYLGYLAWKNLPTLEGYRKAHPDCMTNRGIKCNQCGSPSIKNWGLRHANDERRQHICNHCNTTLYRSGWDGFTSRINPIALCAAITSQAHL